MKRFVIEQTGRVELEAERQFVVEVPDHFTEGHIEELLQHTSLPDEEGWEWADCDCLWAGDEVEIDMTDVYELDPNSVSEGRLKVIKLGDAK